MHWRILNRPHQEIKSQAALCIQVRVFGHVTGFRSAGVPADFFFKNFESLSPNCRGSFDKKWACAKLLAKRGVHPQHSLLHGAHWLLYTGVCVVWPYITVIVVLLLHVFPHVPQQYQRGESVDHKRPYHRYAA